MRRLKAMIRWKYALPRLAVVALVVCFFSFALAPLTHWTVVTLGQSITGAAVEIAELQTSVVHTEISLNDVQLASASQPMKNLLQADSMRFDLSASALLRKKLVIQDGSIRGLRFDTPRTTSGALPETPLEEEPPEEEVAAEPLDLGWLADLGDNAQDRLLEEFETLRLSEELLETWPARYTQLEDQVDILARRAKKLKNRIRDFAKTKSKQPGDVFEMESEIRQIHEQSQALRGQITELVARLNEDRLRVDAARHRDTKKIREIVFDEKLDAETISQYLLKKEMAQKIRSALDWLAWGREHIPRRVPETKPVPGKGLDIFFRGGRQIPDLLVERLHLDGQLQFDKKQLPFEGVATNFTSEPQLLSQPATLRLHTTDAARIELVAVFDRRGPNDHSSVTLDCPRIAQAQRSLGKQEQLAIVVSHGYARVHGHLELADDALSGTLEFSQQDIEIEPRVGSKLGGARVAGYLAESLRPIHQIEGRLQLSGTLRSPKFRVQSSLGSEIAAALKQVGQHEIAHQRQRLESQLTKLADQQTAKLLAQVESQQQQLVAKLGLADETVAVLKKELVQRVGIPNQFLGKDLPVGKFFK